MNIARKINTAALSAYQMIYNLLLITVCVALTVVWLVSLVKNTTPWNGIDENDAWGVLVFGFLVAAATVPSLEGSGKMFIPIIIVSGEVIAFLWNIVGFALHLFTDIPYFVAEKKKKVV